MNTKTRNSTLAVFAIVVSGLLGAFVLVRAQHPPPEPADAHDHDGEHDHDAHQELEPIERETGHADHAGHDDHDDESGLNLDSKERERYGIKLTAARRGSITSRIRLPGEVVLNADRVAHVVPRAPGIVREVLRTVGEEVRAGEVMAWIESAELGEAKVHYLTRRTELDCCTIDLTRAQEVQVNTVRLLELLKSTPSLETLRDLDGLAMGDNRSALITAYSELVFAEAAYRREGQLLEKKVSSERDFQMVEAAYKKADALYAAKRDSIDFAVKRDLLEARRVRQVREMELKGAERRLYVLGLAADDIRELDLVTKKQASQGKKESDCNDPNCTECKKGSKQDQGPSESVIAKIEEKLAWYPLRAPFDGTVIEKHLTLGEKHGDESNAFTIADLTTVWVDISVYQKDLAYVRKGQHVYIDAGPGGAKAEGVIKYVAPILDEHTRTALARLVLPNPDGQWRPGLFVSAEIPLDRSESFILIPKDAVQRMDGGPAVFIETEHGFEPVTIELGRADEESVEVLAGLFPGQMYVVEGAFELKAKMVTGNMGAHAGHGH